MRLTLRTLLAYLDDTLEPSEAAAIGHKLADSQEAQALVERIRRVTRRRGLSTPPSTGTGTPSDPNTVAGYLSDSLPPEQLREFEETCIESDPHLAEVAACHQILTLLLSEQLRVPPTAYQRMYRLVKGRESIPGRKPGTAIPVGGMIEPTGAGADDDSDLPFLLGMSDRGKGGGNALIRWGLAAALAAGFVLAVVMVWPKKPAEVVLAPTPPAPDAVPMPRPVEPKPDAPQPPDEPKKDPMPVDPMPMPPVEPKKDPLPPVEPMPMPPVEPKKDPLLELVPAKTPIRPGRVAGPDLDPTGPPVVATKAGDAVWTTLIGENARLFTSDRVVCLPGFKAKLKTTGGQILLWGNVPELQPIPVLETAITPHDPYQGYEADFTLHVGRVYLTATKPAGAKFRVRFLEEIWDVTVADDKTEVVVEVEHTAAPSADESARTFAALHVNAGTAAFRSRQTDAPKVAAGEEFFWTSTGAGLVGPRTPDPKSKRQTSAYYARTGIAPNAEIAKGMLTAIDAAGKKLAAAASVPGAIDELIQDESPTQSAACLGVYAAAALGEHGRVADALNDPKRFLVRVAGRQAARELLALPGGEGFFKAASKKLRLDQDGERLLSAGLRGLTDRQKKSAEVIDLLVKQLEADEVALRDLAFDLLVFQIDPTAQKNKALFPFDAAAPAEFRAPVVAAWQKRAEELKRMPGM